MTVTEQNQRLQTIVDAIPQKIWTAHADGSNDYFNRCWYEYTGVGPGDTDGSGWLDLVHPDERALTWSRWQHSLASGEHFEIEYRLRHRSGEYRWMLARARAVRDKHGNVERWYGTCTDIQRPKTAEQALMASEQRYRVLIQAGATGVWMASPDGLITDGWNWGKFSDKHPDSFLDSNWLSTLHPDDRQQAMLEWQQALLSTTLYEAEFRVQQARGEYRWVFVRAVPLTDSSGTVREWIGIASDIQERKQAEEHLRTSEERLRLAIETTALGIWDVDLITGFREWTEEAKAILGLEAEIEVTRESFLERVHPDDRGEVEANFFSFSPEAPLHYEGTYRIIRADTGEERWVNATGRTLLNPNGQPVRKIGTIQDITARKRSEMALRDNEKRLLLALQAGRMDAWEQDLKTNFVTRSPNAVGLLGISSGPLSETLEHIHPEDRPLREHFRPGGGVKGSEIIEFRYTTPNGRSVWLALRGEWAGPDRLIGVTFDISDRKEAEAEIWRVANHDALTGLPNRALFMHRLEGALEAAKRDGASVSVLLIDFDHFKEINDALGHDAGDTFLKEAAARLKALTRHCDTVARFSGDEFALLVVEPLRLEHASRLAEIMIAKLSEPMPYLGRSIASAASIGVAAFPDHDATPADLLKDADIALFEAKAQGRSRAVTYCPSLRQAVEQRSALLQEVREALPKGEIVPFYQPKVCLESGQIAGLEVLARWVHPSRGVLSPIYFGAAFDDPRLALALSESLLTKAAADLRRWLEAGLDPGRVAFNLSAFEFSQPGLTDHVFHILNEAGIPPEHFEVEVTETVLLSRNPDSISAILKRFHDQGVSVALDDFGTGFASLTHLKQFPVDHIKIDRSFVQNLEQDEADKAIVSAIIDLSRKLGKRVTAEGVETDGQRLLLRELGCDYGQGYLFSKPVEPSQITSMLR